MNRQMYPLSCPSGAEINIKKKLSAHLKVRACVSSKTQNVRLFISIQWILFMDLAVPYKVINERLITNFHYKDEVIQDLCSKRWYPRIWWLDNKMAIYATHSKGQRYAPSIVSTCSHRVVPKLSQSCPLLISKSQSSHKIVSKLSESYFNIV